MSDARAEVLGRIRAALGPRAAAPEVPRAYRRAGAAEADVERFCERVADYRATVHRCRPEALDALVAAILGAGPVAVPPAPPCGLQDLEAVPDGPDVAAEALDRIGRCLTGCALAIAETGTIVLDGGPACGRRALTLVPDHHVCVVQAGQVVAALPDAVAGLPRAAPLTFVSGPSATSDIELERVEGVHGPRRLDVVVVAGSRAQGARAQVTPV